MKKDLVWAFDLGKASIGEAVREGIKFLHVASNLIPEDFAETKSAATRRRMACTRTAHKQREKWLRKVLSESGIEVLHGRNYDKKGNWKPGEPADPRFEREFSQAGDPTCYTSCLLRIKLLNGEKLQSWQIFKALHSAIQRRGYDTDIPWKRGRGSRTNKQDDEELGTQARMEEFTKALDQMAPGKPQYHFPCYFDAWKMGLWNPEHPTLLKERIDCTAQSTLNQVVPRRLVEREIRELIEQASKQYPKLKGKAAYILYGPAEVPYASYNLELRKKFKLKEGGASDWNGVLGQKIPRFDNRIIEKCILIPRFNVCKIKSDNKSEFENTARLPREVSFLMKLKNMRVERNGTQTGLTCEEINQIFKNPKFSKLAITPAAWSKLCETWHLQPVVGHTEVTAPQESGRSRFCRPALKLLKQLILSGQNPAEFHKQEIQKLNGNTDPLKALVDSDLSFLLKMGTTWDSLYIPNQKIEALVRNSPDKNAAIQQLIGSQNDPIVRHRLGLFARRVIELEEEFGTPDIVVLEFVREDFMGKKAKLEYNKFIRDRANIRAQSRKEAAEAGATEGSAGFKLELLKAQGGICIYTGEPLIPTQLDQYEIDHIVPRERSGPDAALNYILTTRQANKTKSKRTPFEWLSTSPGWDAYTNRVRKLLPTLRHKKAQLLLSSDAETLVQKYTALAETAWISKLAQGILDLWFGWKNGNDDTGTKRVIIISGGLTGRIRRKNGLNRILNPQAVNEEEAETKNRSDKRHHALDAMVISFIPAWARDKNKTGFFSFPKGVDKTLFEREIKNVIPTNICFEKPVLAETIYGARKSENGKTIVQRAELKHLAQKPEGPGKTKFNLDYAKKQAHAIRDYHIQTKVVEFLQSSPSEKQWDEFAGSFYLKQKNGTNGSRVKFVTLNVGDPTEYKDLSKDGTGSYRKGLKGHKGQFVYLDHKGKYKVRPVYAFESAHEVRNSITNELGKNVIKGFFKSRSLVRLENNVEHPKTPLLAGGYSLNTLRSDGYVVVTDYSGRVSKPIHVSKLFAAGFGLISYK